MTRLSRGSCIAVAVLVAACNNAPARDDDKTLQTGEASFYGNEFAGQKTANGEKLKLDGMTAASRTLPLGSRVKVTNVETGQSTQVRINDRGPYAKGRVLDLTPRAAQHIGLDKDEGVTEVKISTVPTHTP